VISPSQKLLPDNTHNAQETDIHDTDGIQTPNLSKRATADQRLRPRGHWDWRCLYALDVIKNRNVK